MTQSKGLLTGQATEDELRYLFPSGYIPKSLLPKPDGAQIKLVHQLKHLIHTRNHKSPEVREKLEELYLMSTVDLLISVRPAARVNGTARAGRLLGYEGSGKTPVKEGDGESPIPPSQEEEEAEDPLMVAEKERARLLQTAMEQLGLDHIMEE